MNELVDVRADTVAPGTLISIAGATILVTAIETHDEVVDLHTEYGPALRLLRTDWLAAVVEVDLPDAA